MEDHVIETTSKGFDLDLVDDLLGNSTRQIWEKVAPAIREARERYDPRLYEHFEYLYDEITRRDVPGQPASAMSGTGVVSASRNA